MDSRNLSDNIVLYLEVQEHDKEVYRSILALSLLVQADREVHFKLEKEAEQKFLFY